MAKGPDEWFAEKVAACRAQRGWTQAELARRMQAEGYPKYSQMTAMRTEKRLRPVPFGEALALSRVLGFSVIPQATGDDYRAGFGDGLAEAIRCLEARESALRADQ